jgi:MtN3 and saliva related transmembrane protein
MAVTDWIGAVAATLTTTAFIPQVIKVWQTRHTKDISLGMYVIFTSGVAMWAIYGWMIASWPVVAANVLTFLLAGSVLAMKLRYG